jgi:Ca2+-binding RTX toxin-like protein
MANKKNKVRGTRRADELFGTDGRDVIVGKSGDDVITSYGGKDKVKGGRGDDIITTGEGKDKAWGGAGSDLFVTENGGKGYVKVMDFEAVDKIKFCGCVNTVLEQRGDDVWVVKGSDVKAVIKNFDAADLSIDFGTGLITVAADLLA